MAQPARPYKAARESWCSNSLHRLKLSVPVNDLDGLTVDEPLGALEILINSVHGPRGRQVNLDLSDQVPGQPMTGPYMSC